MSTASKKRSKRLKYEKLKNKRLVKKYYWLAPREWWSGKICKDYDYSYIHWGWCPGWDKTFGQMFMDELGQAIKESGQKNFTIDQIKEKYGRMCCYTGGCCQKAHDIISKYEMISQNVCMYCGCEAPMLDDGWMYVACLDCFKKIYRNREKYVKNAVPKTDEEITEIWEKIIIDKPDEDGKYHIPLTYKYTQFYPDKEKEIVTVDISDTVKKIRKRINGYKGRRRDGTVTESNFS